MPGRAHARGGIDARPPSPAGNLNPDPRASVADLATEIAQRYADEIRRATGREAIVLLPHPAAGWVFAAAGGSLAYGYEACAMYCRHAADTFDAAHAAAVQEREDCWTLPR